MALWASKVSGAFEKQVPGQGNVLCSWARQSLLHVQCLSPPQVYIWVKANVMLGITCDGLASHSWGRGRGGVEILLVVSHYLKAGYAPSLWAAWLVWRLYLRCRN